MILASSPESLFSIEMSISFMAVQHRGFGDVDDVVSEL